jgi:hypothetical protein
MTSCGSGEPWPSISPVSRETALERGEAYVTRSFGCLENSGLLVCFGCNLDTTLQEKISTEESDTKLNLVHHIREQVRLTPLEILADAVERYAVSNTVARELFGAYAEFLNVLNDKKSREALEKLRAADSTTDPTFKHVREISEESEHALDHVFFENSQLAPLTRKYGVF